MHVELGDLPPLPVPPPASLPPPPVREAAGERETRAARAGPGSAQQLGRGEARRVCFTMRTMERAENEARSPPRFFVG